MSAARQALQLNPSDPQLLKEAIVLLVQHGRTSDALDILGKVSGALSATPQISLLKALVLALSNQLPASERLFHLIENRWPEWSQAWLAHSLVLQFRGDSQQARSSLDAAIALGAPPVLVALARSTPLPESGPGQSPS